MCISVKIGLMQNNMKIAITGGIGSGKSTVSKIIKEEGYSVFSCDEIYAELLCDKSFSESIKELFGPEIFENNLLDRKKLSEIVFNDAAALQKLNKLAHPAVIKCAIQKMEGLYLSFCEVPLLFENGFESLFDGVIVIQRNKQDRINSVVLRDDLIGEEVEKRINAQFDYDIGDFAMYYVIHNNGDMKMLRDKTVDVLNKIKEKLF